MFLEVRTQLACVNALFSFTLLTCLLALSVGMLVNKAVSQSLEENIYKKNTFYTRLLVIHSVVTLGYSF